MNHPRRPGPVADVYRRDPGRGAALCPSIETRSTALQASPAISYFLSRRLTSNEIYPNGISTSLAFDVQLKLVHSIRGSSGAHRAARLCDRV